ncbi:MAG: hypothetical protein HZA92_09310 [Verrucomicrobia bacterium]|nr:hypothetical protein [Verrucomicrobiota bacterium]
MGVEGGWFKRLYATRVAVGPNRGLKPTATFKPSLREENEQLSLLLKT